MKKNSLFGTAVQQTQDTIENCAYKIAEGKKAMVTGDMMIIARIESLILNRGMDDALERAQAYIAAGADGIMIHSKSRDSDEIMRFCDEYGSFESRVHVTHNVLMAILQIEERHGSRLPSLSPRGGEQQHRRTSGER